MEHTWDNQLDNMLDDLQASVHPTASKTEGVSVAVEKSSSRHYYQSSTINQTSYETNSEEKFYSSNNLISDLSIIQQVKSVNKTSESGVRPGSSSSTQQSLKKNINELDHLLSNLSTTEVKLQNNSEFHKEDRRERLSRTNSFRREGSGRITPRDGSGPFAPRDGSGPFAPRDGSGRLTPRDGSGRLTPRDGRLTPRDEDRLMFTSSEHKTSYSTEFRPVHTSPDPLTGRYADGRITPNHGYTKTFEKNKSELNNNGDIPKKPDELLHNFGENIDSRELEKIDQVEKQRAREAELVVREYDDGLPAVRGPPVFYPTEEMYSTKREKVFIESSSSGKKEKSESGGAAVIPVCLPLCCAAPCVIM